MVSFEEGSLGMSQQFETKIPPVDGTIGRNCSLDVCRFVSRTAASRGQGKKKYAHRRTPPPTSASNSSGRARKRGRSREPGQRQLVSYHKVVHATTAGLERERERQTDRQTEPEAVSHEQGSTPPSS